MLVDLLGVINSGVDAMNAMICRALLEDSTHMFADARKRVLDSRRLDIVLKRLFRLQHKTRVLSFF